MHAGTYCNHLDILIDRFTVCLDKSVLVQVLDLF
uniref:Uncharacterized protein n=1 Tax=Arundo donax TaxID=35708 RepID=A0A0A9C573_ARUDO